MQTIVIISCCAWMLFGIVSSAQFTLDESYLNVPSEDEQTKDPAAALVREALNLLSHSIESNKSAAKSLSECANQLKLNERNLDKLAVYDMINKLDDESRDSCREKLATIWLRVFALIKSQRKPDEISFYLLQRGASKFLVCASKAEQDFELLLTRPQEQRKVAKFMAHSDRFLDSILELGVNVARKSNDKLLTASAEQFKLIDWFRSSRLFEYVRRRTMGEVGIIDAYFKRQCSYIKYTIGDMFGQINLGRALAGYKLKNPTLIRLNEYFRIFCIEPQEPKMRKKLEKMNCSRGGLFEQCLTFG